MLLSFVSEKIEFEEEGKGVNKHARARVFPGNFTLKSVGPLMIYWNDHKSLPTNCRWINLQCVGVAKYFVIRLRNLSQNWWSYKNAFYFWSTYLMSSKIPHGTVFLLFMLNVVPFYRYSLFLRYRKPHCNAGYLPVTSLSFCFILVKKNSKNQ